MSCFLLLYLLLKCLSFPFSSHFISSPLSSPSLLPSALPSSPLRPSPPLSFFFSFPPFLSVSPFSEVCCHHLLNHLSPPLPSEFRVTPDVEPRCLEDWWIFRPRRSPAVVFVSCWQIRFSSSPLLAVQIVLVLFARVSEIHPFTVIVNSCPRWHNLFLLIL